ncbi:hypothetical protein [Duganella guangzhouensis]|nr:hypothetical protein [Duganella guangzhouensis]
MNLNDAPNNEKDHNTRAQFWRRIIVVGAMVAVVVLISWCVE